MNRNKALIKLSAVQFAAWELHMYLDTHPEDKQAKMRYSELMSEYSLLKSEFESKFGPITKPATGNEWLSDPWPWDITKESDC